MVGSCEGGMAVGGRSSGLDLQGVVGREGGEGRNMPSTQLPPRLNHIGRAEHGGAEGFLNVVTVKPPSPNLPLPTHWPLSCNASYTHTHTPCFLLPRPHLI